MIAELERALCGSMSPGRVKIALAGEAIGRGREILLRLEGHVIGTTLIESAPSSIESEMEDTLELLATPIAAAIAYRRRPERRGREPGSAHTDSLCRIPNRRAFDEHLQGVRDSRRRSTARSLVEPPPRTSEPPNVATESELRRFRRVRHVASAIYRVVILPKSSGVTGDCGDGARWVAHDNFREPF